MPEVELEAKLKDSLRSKLRGNLLNGLVEKMLLKEDRGIVRFGSNRDWNEGKHKMPVSETDLLAEIEEVIRLMPTLNRLGRGGETDLLWLARASAAMDEYHNVAVKADWSFAARAFESGRLAGDPQSRLFRILHQVRNSLRLRTVGPVNAAIGQGFVFDYLDTMRRFIESAKTEVFFVDRYLNGDFISTYLPFVSGEVSVRLLVRNEPPTARYVQQLIAMGEMFHRQHGTQIEVRSHSAHHERLLIVDASIAVLSGASFKDGPATAGATIIEQKGEALAGLMQAHENLWQDAKLEAKWPE